MALAACELIEPSFMLLFRNTDSVGPLSPAAELLNGRSAMIGFAAMIVLESFSDKALF